MTDDEQRAASTRATALELARLADRVVWEAERATALQRIVNTVWQILTSDSQAIAAQFSESRVRCDSDRINYVLELLEAHVTNETRSPDGDGLASWKSEAVENPSTRKEATPIDAGRHAQPNPAGRVAAGSEPAESHTRSRLPPAGETPRHDALRLMSDLVDAVCSRFRSELPADETDLRYRQGMLDIRGFQERANAILRAGLLPPHASHPGAVRVARQLDAVSELHQALARAGVQDPAAVLRTLDDLLTDAGALAQASQPKTATDDFPEPFRGVLRQCDDLEARLKAEAAPHASPPQREKHDG